MEATEEIERLRLEKEIASQAEIEAIQAYDHQRRLYRFQVRPGRVTEAFGAFYLPSSWRHQPQPELEPVNHR